MDKAQQEHDKRRARQAQKNGLRKQRRAARSARIRDMQKREWLLAMQRIKNAEQKDA